MYTRTVHTYLALQRYACTLYIITVLHEAAALMCICTWCTSIVYKINVYVYMNMTKDMQLWQDTLYVCTLSQKHSFFTIMPQLSNFCSDWFHQRGIQMYSWEHFAQHTLHNSIHTTESRPIYKFIKICTHGWLVELHSNAVRCRTCLMFPVLPGSCYYPFF